MAHHIVRLSLAALWFAVASAKLLSPVQYEAWLGSVIGLDAGTTGVAVGLTIGYEFLLALLIAVGSLLSVFILRMTCAISWTTGAVAAVVAVLTKEEPSCGCFGRLAESGLSARLIVAGAVMWLSYDLWRIRTASLDGENQ